MGESQRFTHMFEIPIGMMYKCTDIKVGYMTA